MRARHFSWNAVSPTASTSSTISTSTSRLAATENAGRPRSILEVDSLPSGAAVFVDGTELGITPYKRAVFSGKHKVILSHVGYRSEQRETEVTQGASHRVEVTLVLGSEPTTTATAEKTPVYKKWSFKEDFPSDGASCLYSEGRRGAGVISSSSAAAAPPR